jgi:hypothetical protein
MKPIMSAKQLPPTSGSIPTGGGFVKSVEDYRWKRGVTESEATIKAIQDKKRRIAPLYSKGAAQYITDGEDLNTLGKKT